MGDVRLEVNGSEYGGWTDVRVTRGIEAIASSFDLSVSERWDNQSQPWPINEEDECVLSIDGETLITGYVDVRGMKIAPEAHTLSISGRSRAGALVDNSAVLKQWEFANVGVLEIVTKLAAEFNIAVALQDGISDTAVSSTARPATSKGSRGGGAPSSVGSAGKSSSMKIGKPNTKIAINPGESPFEVIDRICRTVGVLPVSDSFGGIVLTRAGGVKATTSLVEGVNIISGESTNSAAGRYRRYIVQGQSAGSDDLFGQAAAAVQAEAADNNVRRTERVLLVRPDGVVSIAFAKQRAAWEATVRAARSASASVVVQGWTQDDGTLWPFNAIAQVKSASLGLNGLMLITEVTHETSDKGTTTQLKLTRPDAFIPEPVILKVSAGGGGFSDILGS